VRRDQIGAAASELVHLDGAIPLIRVSSDDTADYAIRQGASKNGEGVRARRCPARRWRSCAQLAEHDGEYVFGVPGRARLQRLEPDLQPPADQERHG
jgi:hypothetical protein